MKHWGLKCKMQRVYLICYSFKMKICSLTRVSNFTILRYVRPLQLGLFPQQWNKWNQPVSQGTHYLTAFCQPSETVLISAPEKTVLLLQGLHAKELVMTSLRWKSKALWILTQVLMCMVSTDSNWSKESLKKLLYLSSLSLCPPVSISSTNN